MKFVGTPANYIEGMRQAPFWPALEAIAPTLAYDNLFIFGEDRSVPIERVARVTVPTLVMNGGASPSFMEDTARALANAIPHAQHHILAGQVHNVNPEALAPELIAFFGARV